MSNPFFERPILNSPYDEPAQHWDFDPESGQLISQEPVKKRRKAEFLSPIPKPRRGRGARNASQTTMDLRTERGLDASDGRYETNDTIMAIRNLVGKWRAIPDPAKWKVTPTTQRLLQHWRRDDWAGRRPFFCQVEAVEVLIYLTEVAPHYETGRRLLKQLEDSSRTANPELNRLALKLATGAGKTMVMAMIIAWNTLNKVRQASSSRFTKGFLIVAPGLTIRDRLRVLQPSDPENYYKGFDLLPTGMLADMGKARIVITNYHAFKLREKISLTKVGKELLRGREEKLNTQESESQMIQRVMRELMGMKNILVINDEAHHCYRRRPIKETDGYDLDDLKGAERKYAKQQDEEARMWISGLEAVQRKLGLNKVIDLSATPFFLKGSGYREGTLFHWTASDFSLMDAIECGIVKLPRVPVADNIPGAEVPMYRDLWTNIRTDMPKKGRGKSGELDPMEVLPTKLQTALAALYGHYKETFELWKEKGLAVPPCFIIVCNNTSASKLVYDYISGYRRPNGDWQPAKFDLFSNYDDYGNSIGRPNTLLIDSEQLESGDALDPKFRALASDEIERFKYEIRQRNEGGGLDADNLDEADLLREVMNTVGKPGKLGGGIRCVVSVSMLTEGWDANNVTHILGVRAFGSQLLCEQVIGRALRRRNYELNEEGKFNVEYADILGIPFNFASEAVKVAPQPPVERWHVKAMRPDRNHLEIRFPRVRGYRTESIPPRLEVAFEEEDKMTITPDDVGPTRTLNAGIVGEQVNLNLDYTKDLRFSKIVYEVATRLLLTRFTDGEGRPEMGHFASLRRITAAWLKDYLVCKGGAYPAQLMHLEIMDKACENINRAITRSAQKVSETYIRALTDPFNPVGSTNYVNFFTTKDIYLTDAFKCPVNYAVLDSTWEGEFCRVAESHPRVLRYVKNQGLGFEIPYLNGGVRRSYIPDFILIVDDGKGPDDPLNLIVEVKGFRREDAVIKARATKDRWIPGVNVLKGYGRWAFAEFGDVYMMETDFAERVEAEMNRIITTSLGGGAQVQGKG